jgi:Bacterial regulatory proteins, lacI family.
MKKVTIQDVARELNLSRNTVAKALNNSDKVSYDTRYLVIKKAYEMGYTKLSPAVLNEFKLHTKMEETKTIVVLTRREISLYSNSIIMGISDELNINGCKIQLNFISDQDEKIWYYL